MGWPYEFIDLSSEEKHLRRQTLDRYALIAHYSAFAPAIIALLVRLIGRLVASQSGSRPDAGDRGRYAHIPGSPVVKAQRNGPFGGLAAWWRRTAMWFGDDVVVAGVNWGQRDEWFLGLGWVAWLLVLTFLETGKDYLHLTKRFGIIAVSQAPIQYLLSLKTLNPFAWALHSSHEHVNRYHRVLGRIIYALLLTHIVLYNVFFFLKGIWLARFFAPVVFCGVVASLGFDALMGTAMASVRRYSYRLFFVVHLVTALFVPILLFFHAHSARWYVGECVVIFIAHLAIRKFGTVTSPSTIVAIPGTSLIKISAPLPAEKTESFRVLPGSHLYLSLPPEGRSSKFPASTTGIFDFLCHPFTVATVGEDKESITIIVRKRSGPMTNLLADFASANSSSGEDKIPLAIEGPYGTMGRRFQDLLSWGPSRILLISGGVGATFTVPLYQAIQSDLPTAKIQLIWAIRSAGDATWAINEDTIAGSASGKGLLNDPNVHLYLTGDMGISDDASHEGVNRATTNGQNGGDSVELSPMVRDARRGGSLMASRNRKRPNLERVVDDAFLHGLDDKVAVLVCGPETMAKEVRSRVRPWVMKGREVWWHNESFGW